MVRPLLLICVFVGFGFHRLKCSLIYMLITLMPSHILHHAHSRVLLNTEVEKKNKYPEACAARRVHFTPLCFSVDGLAGSEANCFLKWMACRLSSQWDRSYAKVLGWIRSRLAFAIVRASVLCVRGSHTKMEKLVP